MSTAAWVDLEADQGADFGVQLYWLDPVLTPYQLLAPMKMEIRQLDNLRLVHTLTSTDSAGITFSASNGLIQLIIPRTVTDGMKPDTYLYDLFVTYRQDPTTTRVRKLIRGNFILNAKVTQSV
jgi:hypothetical protein